MFEIEFVDGDGNTLRKIVPNHRLARELAKGIATSTGKRVIVRRRQSLWNMLLIDLEDRKVIEVGQGYTMESAIKLLEAWDFGRENAVLVPWPESVAVPS
jgi:hypothetical protein